MANFLRSPSLNQTSANSGIPNESQFLGFGIGGRFIGALAAIDKSIPEAISEVAPSNSPQLHGPFAPVGKFSRLHVRIPSSVIASEHIENLALAAPTLHSAKALAKKNLRSKNVLAELHNTSIQ